MTLKHTPSLCPPPPKSHKYGKYEKAPYIVSSYHQPHEENLEAVLTCYPQAELTPPTLPQHNNKEFDLQLGKSEKESVINASMYRSPFKIL